jgi:hypothetical protein
MPTYNNYCASPDMCVHPPAQDAEGAGVVMQSASILGLFGSVIRDCKVSNAVVLDSARVLARGNTFCNSRYSLVCM